MLDDFAQRTIVAPQVHPRGKPRRIDVQIPPTVSSVIGSQRQHPSATQAISEPMARLLHVLYFGFEDQAEHQL